MIEQSLKELTLTDSSQMYQFLCIRTTHVDCSVPILPMQNTDVSVELTCSAYFNNKRNLIIIFASSQLAPMLRRFLIHLTRVTLVLPPKRVMTFRDMTSPTKTKKQTNRRDPRIFITSGLQNPSLPIITKPRQKQDSALKDMPIYSCVEFVRGR